MDNLKLTFPSPHPGTHLLVEIRPEAFSLWLEELPSGNMPRYVIEIADAVTNINRTEIPISQRIELMKLVDLAYEKIHNFYRPLMKTGPHKGNHAPQKELDEVYRLTRELSFAYKIAVIAFIDKKPLFGKNKNLAQAINMALHYLGLVLLEHYELYAPIPMHIWKEIHQLYYCAESQNLSEFKNPDNDLNNCFYTVETTYLRNCLIALSNPYHLQRGDHWEVFIYLSHWIKDAVISDDPDDFSNKHCFVIDLNGDDKPLSIQELVNNNNVNYRFLLTQQMKIRICHQIDEIMASNKSIEQCFSRNVIAKKSTELLDELLDSWECKQQRTAPRYPKISRMDIIWGLTNIHKVISGFDPLQKSLSAEELAENETLIEHEWQTINSSEGGTCIAQSKNTTIDIDVGLLVAIRQTVNDSRETTWVLGTICWMIGNQRNGTQIGIQYLKGQVQAVELQARKGNKIETRFQPALLVSGEMVNNNNMPTLLTRTGLYIESRPMLLKIGEEEQFIHARLKVSSIGVVDRFFYQLAHQHIQTQHDQESSSDENITSESKPNDNTESKPNDNQSADIDSEIINLSAMPLAHVEDFDHETEEAKKAIRTLDDMIVSKNK